MTDLSPRARKLLARLKTGAFYRPYDPKLPKAMQELIEAGLVTLTGRAVVFELCYVPSADYQPMIHESFLPQTDIDDLAARLRTMDDDPLSAPRQAAEALRRLAHANATYQQNAADTWAAMSAMRDTINEVIPMPSAESDLSQGPEASVFCATVAACVVAGVTR